MSDLFVAVVSMTPTKRRRWLWAAWWTGPPARVPFRKPDAARGGAQTREEALREAEAAAGRALVEIEGRWARAWARVLMGQPPWTPKELRAAEASGAEHARPPRGRPAPPGSVWQVLGVGPRATTEEIKRAFRTRALASHPDHGGDAAEFRDLRRAYDEALNRRERGARRPKRRG